MKDMRHSVKGTHRMRGKMQQKMLVVMILFFGVLSGAKAQEVINLITETKDVYEGTAETLFLPYTEIIQVNMNPAIKQMEDKNMGDKMIIQLFDHSSYQATIDRISINRNGTFSIRARLDDYPMGYIILSETDLSYLGSIRIPEKNERYSLKTDKKSGQTYLKKLDIEKLDILEGSFDEIPSGLPKLDKDQLEMLIKASEKDPDRHAFIDVMIVYTPAAAAHANEANGGIHNTVAQAMEKAQLALDNSQTGITMTLVYSDEVNYTESGSSNADLYRLTASSSFNPFGLYWNEYYIPGYMNEVHDWREAYGADLVSLFSLASDTGGLGWLLYEKKGRPDWGFSMTRVQQAAWTYTHIHEIGHNMGAHHHKQQNVQPGPTGWYDWPDNIWSAGWRWRGDDNNMYCDLMTYSSGQYYSDGIDATRLPYFSDPGIHLMGAPAGHPSDGDNNRTLKEVKHVIAAYRNEMSDIPYIGAIPAVLNFETVLQGHWATLEYSLIGRNIATEVIVTAPEGFWVSLHPENDFSTSLRLPSSEGYVESRIYVRFMPSGNQTSFQDKILNSSGDLSVEVQVYGEQELLRCDPPSAFFAEIQENKTITLRWTNPANTEPKSPGQHSSPSGKSVTPLSLINFLTGYDIYRNGSLLASADTSERAFNDGPLEAGVYEYYITARYKYCESEPLLLNGAIVIRDSYSINYIAGANGSISGELSQTVAHGGTGTAVEAIPNEGYHFVQWSDGVTDNPRIESIVVEHITVTAEFAINRYAITATADPPEGGAVTGAMIVEHGASVTLTAVPAAGYYFEKWTENGSWLMDQQHEFSFTAVHEKDLVAYFVNKDYILLSGYQEWTSPATGFNSIIVHADKAWHATPNTDWMSVYPNFGNPGMTPVTISWLQNMAAGDRSGQLMFQNEATTASYIIGQEGVVLSSGPVASGIQTISVFPNPATDYISIKGIPEHAKVQLINILGGLVFEASSTDAALRVSVKAWPKGIYFLIISMDDRMVSKKIVIK